MFYSGNAHVAISQHSASLGVYYFLGNGIDDGLAFQVNALYLVSMILWRGIEDDSQVKACM